MQQNPPGNRQRQIAKRFLEDIGILKLIRGSVPTIEQLQSSIVAGTATGADGTRLRFAEDEDIVLVGFIFHVILFCKVNWPAQFTHAAPVSHTKIYLPNARTYNSIPVIYTPLFAFVAVHCLTLPLQSHDFN